MRLRQLYPKGVHGAAHDHRLDLVVSPFNADSQPKSANNELQCIRLGAYAPDHPPKRFELSAGTAVSCRIGAAKYFLPFPSKSLRISVKCNFSLEYTSWVVRCGRQQNLNGQCLARQVTFGELL